MRAGPGREPVGGRAGQPGDPLSTRALNRALLDRQFLLHRHPGTARDVIEHLVGLQAQSTTAPYFGLWTRLARFATDDLSTLIEDRSVTRLVLMRSTLHLVTTDDCVGLRALLQPFLAKSSVSQWRRHLDGVDTEELAALGRELVEQRPLTWAELGRQLAARWPGRDGNALALTVRGLLPLVQVPPRGIWGATGDAAHTTAESWLGRSMAPEMTANDLVLRYLTAFGPASIQDMAKWSGMTGLRTVFGRLADRLRVFRTETGTVLYDVPDGPLPDPDEPVPVRFVAEFDNILLSHVDRSRIMSDAEYKVVFGTNGRIKATILVDGFVRGIWSITRQRGAATLVAQPFGRISREHRAALTDEGERLLAFAAADARTRDIRFADAP